VKTGIYPFLHFLPLEERGLTHYISSPLRGEDEGGGEIFSVIATAESAAIS